MRAPIAKIRISAGNPGWYDPLTNIHLTITRPEALVYEGQNVSNIKNAINYKLVHVVEGDLDLTVREAKAVTEEVREVIVQPVEEVKTKAIEKEEVKAVEEEVKTEEASEEVEVVAEEVVEEEKKKTTKKATTKKKTKK